MYWILDHHIELIALYFIVSRVYFLYLKYFATNLNDLDLIELYNKRRGL